MNATLIRIAIPLAQKKMSLHFGHCEEFVLVDADTTEKKIIEKNYATPPPHEPGVLPKWLAEKKVNVIIAGGMGQRAQQLFLQNNIKVVVGAEAGEIDDLVHAYLNNTLTSGTNLCDH